MREMGSTCASLQAAIANELFEFQDVHKFERNPMTYAHCADLNIYIARNFAPLKDRVRSLTPIESANPEYFDRRQNESGVGVAQATHRTRDPNRTRFRRFFAQGHGGSGRCRERSGVARQFSGRQSQSRQRAERFRHLAGERKAAESDAKLRPGRSAISTMANGNRAG